MAGEPTFTLTALTRDPAVAHACAHAGVERVGIDIERMGKSARQGHLPHARISDHQLTDLIALRSAAADAALFARLNAVHPRTQDEVDAALAAGAQVLMAPYFHDAAQVRAFITAVAGRARVALLFETAEAMTAADTILALPGVDEAMVGLNDLSLSLNLPGPFAVFTTDILDRFAAVARARAIPFGIGGLGRVDDVDLPIPADLVIAQHGRLGSSSAWLARSFLAGLSDARALAQEVAALRARLAYWAQAPQGEHAAALARLCALNARAGEP